MPPPRIRPRTPLRLLAALPALFATAGCDIPRDPEGTLDRVRGGTLRVGVTEAPPWMTRDGEAAGGIEADLIRRFARSVGAEVEWSWGPTGQHMEALERYELDLVAGGLTRKTPWKRHVGLTTPFSGDRHVMAVPPGENGFLVALENVLRNAEAAGPPTTEEPS